MASRFCGNKAGMDSLDKSKIQRIIEDNTSQNFGSHEQKRAKRIEERVQKYRQLIAQMTKEQLGQAQKELDSTAMELERKRQLDRHKVHIDMDAFFAAVECRDCPELRTVPMAVGSDAMLSTSNYLARKFGVRSAMPGFIAKKLCPQLVIVPGNHAKYRKESHIIRSIFERYDPNVSMGSLDEAYLDITEFLTTRNSTVCCRRVRYAGDCICRLPLLDGDDNGELANTERSSEICTKCGKERVAVIDSIQFGADVNSVVKQIRFEVEQATGLTCSAGIAANSMLAKICSDLNKPNGQYCLEKNRDKIIEFMRPLPIRKVPGIGPVSEAVLSALEVGTCGQLFEQRALLHLLVYKHYSEWLLRVSLGISHGDADQGSASAEENSNPKSTSIERTFFPPKSDIIELLPIVHRLCEELVASLASEGIVGGRAVTLKIKFATFDVITRCKSVDFTVRTVDILYPIMERLLKRELSERKIAVRLLGVRLSNLIFSDGTGDEDRRLDGKGGIQRSLLGFVRPSTSAATRIGGGGDSPTLIELNSDDEGEGEDGVKAREEEEDIMMMENIDRGEELPEVIDEANNGMGGEENEEENSTMEEEENVSSNDDDDDVIFVDEVAPERDEKKQRTVMKKEGRPKKRREGKAKQQIRKRNSSGTRPRGVKDLRDYFPLIL